MPSLGRSRGERKARMKVGKSVVCLKNTEKASFLDSIEWGGGGGWKIIVDTCVGREAPADQAEGFQLLSKCKGKPWKDAQ